MPSNTFLLICIAAAMELSMLPITSPSGTDCVIGKNMVAEDDHSFFSEYI